MKKSMFKWTQLILLLICLCSCGAEESPPTPQQTVSVFPEELQNVFATQLSYFDKTLAELFEEYEMADYIWYSNKEEAVAINEDLVFFIDSPLNRESVCCGVMFYSQLSNNDVTELFSQIEKVFEDGFSYYLVETEEYILKFLLENDSNEIREDIPNTFIQLNGKHISDTNKAGTLKWIYSLGAPINAQSNDKWSNFFDYVMPLGMPYAELQLHFEHYLEADFEMLDQLVAFDGLKDPESNVQYFSNNGEICDTILIPVSVLLSQNEINISTIKELNTPFTFSAYHGASYIFYTNGVRIVMPANADGTVHPMGYIYVYQT